MQSQYYPFHYNKFYCDCSSSNYTEGYYHPLSYMWCFVTHRPSTVSCFFYFSFLNFQMSLRKIYYRIQYAYQYFSIFLHIDKFAFPNAISGKYAYVFRDSVPNLTAWVETKHQSIKRYYAYARVTKKEMLKTIR